MLRIYKKKPSPRAPMYIIEWRTGEKQCNAKLIVTQHRQNPLESL